MARTIAPRSPASPTKGRILSLAAGLFLAAHGIVHLMGVLLFWHLGQPGSLRYDQAHPAPGSAAGVLVGIGWLAATALFAAAAVAVMRRHRYAIPLAATASLVSIAALAPSAALTVTGLAVDALVLLAVAVATISR